MAGIKVFFSYAHEDEPLQKELAQHLGALRHEGIIEDWWDRQILPGSEWNEEISQKLEEADLILLLVSPAFLNSPFCYREEMHRAVECHNAGSARVVPIALRPCHWALAPFAKLQGLPTDMVPVDSWPTKRKRNAVWAKVAEAIHQAVEACAVHPTTGSSKKKTGDSLFQVPFPRNRFFTGRQETLTSLRKVLKKKGAAAITQVAAITGLGGVGKTQTALEYAYCHRQDYRVVWWIDTETPAGFDLGFTGLARALGLPETVLTDRDRTLAAVRGWLERESGWLLILDNAERPEDVQPYMPATPAGHILITSRNPLWRGMSEMLSLDIWPRAQSVEFLLKHSGRADSDGAEALAAELGDLPLALEQAVSYIEATGQSFYGYLALYHRHFAELVQEFQPAHYPNTVLTTWDVSLAAVEQEAPVASNLLHLFAFVAPDDIPRTLLTEHTELLPQCLTKAIQSELTLDKALAALRRYSLIRVTDEAFAVHRLVQAVTRARLSDSMPWVNAAIVIISTGFPEHSDDVRFWSVCARLRPHAEAALAAAENLGNNSEQVAKLLSQLGAYLQCRGEYLTAQTYQERALRAYETALGPDHSNVAQSLADLGTVLRVQGDLVRARACFERALKISETVFGSDHPNMVDVFKDLGVVLRLQGDLVGAQTCFERALKISETAFGPDHLSAAWPLTCLGTLLRIKRKLKRAWKCHERALRIRETALGSNHHEIAWNLNGLGMLQQCWGNHAGAQAYFERALKISETALGPDHPDVARFLNRLGIVLRTQGDLVCARACFERALKIAETAFGPDHPHVSSYLYSLGRTLRAQGDLAGARTYHEQELRICETALGPNHPRVAACAFDLAGVLSAQGDLTGAQALLGRARQIRKVTRGSDRSSTQRVCSELADLEQGAR